MKRRDLFKLALFAPLVPKVDLLTAAAPAKVATNFASLSPAQIRVWSADLFLEAYKRSHFEAMRRQHRVRIGEIAQSGSARGS